MQGRGPFGVTRKSVCSRRQTDLEVIRPVVAGTLETDGGNAVYDARLERGSLVWFSTPDTKDQREGNGEIQRPSSGQPLLETGGGQERRKVVYKNRDEGFPVKEGETLSINLVPKMEKKKTSHQAH